MSGSSGSVVLVGGFARSQDNFGFCIGGLGGSRESREYGGLVGAYACLRSNFGLCLAGLGGSRGSGVLVGGYAGL